MTYHIGVSASRKGLSNLQLRTIVGLLRGAVATEGVENLCLHQGCCVGGDEQITIAAYTLGIPIVAYPPEIKTYFSQLATELSTTVMRDAPYLDRNERIVGISSMLIAAPATVYASGQDNKSRSGTWYTYRYAKALDGVEAKLVRPDGVIQ